MRGANAVFSDVNTTFTWKDVNGSVFSNLYSASPKTSPESIRRGNKGSTFVNATSRIRSSVDLTLT